MLNVIYKIASGCIARRIKEVLRILINEDQTGYICGRYIGENTRLCMEYTEVHNIPGLLLLIDFEKAFDSVSWEFISNVLDFFHFGPSIKQWFQCFYNITSAVSQAGHLSAIVEIKRGCRHAG